jgi:hypothetical protein
MCIVRRSRYNIYCISICFQRCEIRAVPQTRTSQVTFKLSNKLLQLQSDLLSALDLAKIVLSRQTIKCKAANQNGGFQVLAWRTMNYFTTRRFCLCVCIPKCRTSRGRTEELILRKLQVYLIRITCRSNRTRNSPSYGMCIKTGCLKYGKEQKQIWLVSLGSRRRI